jgi:hypothetical protein
MLDGHVRGEDFVVLACAFQMHMPPEIEEDGPMQWVRRPFQKVGGRLHAVIHSSLEMLHEFPSAVLAIGSE